MLRRSATLALLATLSACAASAAERSFPVTGFDKVSAAGSEDVVITTGKAASVVASGPTDVLDKLEVSVEGTTLKIRRKGNSWGWSNDKTVIRITMPALHGLSLAGSGDVTADKGSGPAFAAGLAGSGDLKIAQIDSPSVTISTSGSGDIMAAGRCDSAKVSIAGSGDIMLAGLQCKAVDIGIAGSGDVSAYATQTANVRISGSGDVKVSGGARCTSRTSGSGTVSCG
ncbi:MAG: hypothetical protein RL490_2477 [Pseudomonadota bacterium]|jgi:hypothetical protein